MPIPNLEHLAAAWTHQGENYVVVRPSIALALYSKAIETVIPVSSPQAELQFRAADVDTEEHVWFRLPLKFVVTGFSRSRMLTG